MSSVDLFSDYFTLPVPITGERGQRIEMAQAVESRNTSLTAYGGGGVQCLDREDRSSDKHLYTIVWSKPVRARKQPVMICQ